MPRAKRDIPWLETRDGVYYVFWSVPAKDGRKARTERLSLRTHDAGTAKARYAAFLTEGTDVYAAGSQGAAYTCGQALDLYKQKRVDPDDIENAIVDKVRQQNAIDNLKIFFGDKPVAKVDLEDCQAYARARRDGTICKLSRGGNPMLARNGTIRRELNVLGAAFSCAAAWRKLTGLSKADLPVLEKPGVPRSKCAYFTKTELAVLRGKAEGRTLDFIDLAYGLAARRTSIETLTVFQVDLKTWLIDLGTAAERAGTAGETVKRRPVIVCPQDCRPLLSRLVREAKAAGTPYLLGRPSNTRRAFQSACKRAGLMPLPDLPLRPSRAPSPHTLRHTRATHMLQQGETPWTVANLLGDNVMTVLRVYAHHCPQHMQEKFGIKEGRDA
jgi:integrase